ncbi:MAG: hypothetical protein P8Y66_00940 [Nitrospirota bacterium]
MPRKIAVLVRDRQAEALRMAVGMTLMDDAIDIYVLDREVEPTEENTLNVETALDMDMGLYTNRPGGGDEQYLSNEEIAVRLLSYDHVIPY